MKAEFEGFSEFTENLAAFSKSSVLKDLAGHMLYEGTGVVADRIKANIRQLPLAMRKWATSDDKRNGATSPQKAGLLKGFGISKMKSKNDSYDIHIGFDGYNSTKTDRWPQGQPNILIARSIEGGTSFLNAHPFVMPAIRASLPTAQNKMIKAFDDYIDQNLK